MFRAYFLFSFFILLYTFKCINTILSNMSGTSVKKRSANNSVMNTLSEFHDFIPICLKIFKHNEKDIDTKLEDQWNK